jgi:hypothetical protein
MPGPPTVGGTPAPLLDIWSAAQAVRVFQPDPLRVWVKTPPTPPIPPRGPQPEPPPTTVGASGTDTIEVPFEDEPAPVKPAKAK